MVLRRGVVKKAEEGEVIDTKKADEEEDAVNTEKAKEDETAEADKEETSDTKKTDEGKAVDAEKTDKETVDINNAGIVELNDIVENIIVVDSKHHCYFLANDGEMIKKIENKFRLVAISFPRDRIECEKVSLKGGKSCIEGAALMIKEIVQYLVELVTIDCEIEQTFHPIMFGAKESKVLLLLSLRIFSYFLPVFLL